MNLELRTHYETAQVTPISYNGGCAVFVVFPVLKHCMLGLCDLSWNLIQNQYFLKTTFIVFILSQNKQSVK